ncbi:MAG: DUF3179 domain-containing protein [Chloroflexi bacterium]|nr:DUF3179 domain-containing protein [Chloroflexota bacterium]
MAISARRVAGLLGLLMISSVALAACQSDSDTGDDSPPAPPAAAPSVGTGVSPTLAPTSTPVPGDASDPAPSATSTPAPSQTPSQTSAPVSPPVLNRDIRSVELDDIVFDRFDGSTTRLSAASNALIERLRDAIKPIYSPQYEDASGGDWLDSNDIILGYVSESGQAYAYPIKFLNFHELVNDVIDGVPLLVTYCPLCGSGIVFDRRVDGEVLVFGNTSALYNSDLVMFDYASGSYWFQTGGEAVVGTMTGTRLTPLPSSVMTWDQWLALYPETNVLSLEQGLGTRSSMYLADPFSTYADYINGGENRFPFPVDTDLVSDSLRPAEIVVAVAIGDHERAYPPTRIGNTAVNDLLDGEPVVVFSRGTRQVATVFSPLVKGRQLEFAYTDGSFRDLQTGSLWNMGGMATSGELEGTRLTPLPSRRAFWFTISISNPDIEVYGQ